MGLHLRRRLSAAPRYGSPRRPSRQHRSHVIASGRDRSSGRSRQPRRSGPRRCGLSRRQGSRRPPQHHPRPPAALRARTQPNRKRLGISARQQARDYRIRQLRRHPRQGMRRLDILRQRPKPHRVHHNPIMGNGHSLRPLVLYQIAEGVTRWDSQIGAGLIQGGERRRFAMSVPIPLRWDFSAPQLRGLAKKAKDGPQARRLLTLAAIYDGATRTEAAKIGGVGLQIIRDWVLRFNAHGPDGLLDRKPPGQPSKLNDGQRQAVAQMIESGPIPAVHGVVRWRLIDLAQWIYEEFRITIAKQTLSRELRAMGYRKLSARPRHHAQAAGAIEDFKKTSPRVWTKSSRKRPSKATR